MRTLIIITFYVILMLASAMPASEQAPSNGTIPQPTSAAYLPLLSNNIPPTATLTPTETALPTEPATATPVPTSTTQPTPVPQPIPVGESITCHSMRVD